MSNIHVCSLFHADTSGLQKLPPNASRMVRLCRLIRRLIIVNPNNFRCKMFFHNKSAILAEQRKHIKSRYYYMIHPFSTLNCFIEVTFFIFWTAKMLVDPMLENMLYISPLLSAINEYFYLTCQKILIVSLFFVGYIDMETREIVIEPKRVWCKYLKTYFIFDLFGNEIYHIFAAPIFKKPDKYWRTIRILDLIHCCCLYVRLNTVISYLGGIGMMLKFNTRVRNAINYVVRTYMLLHFFCCSLYAMAQIVYVKTFPRDSWLVFANIQPSAKPSLSEMYRECLLLTVCYFFGASPGKYNIHQTSEQICVTIIAFFGRMYTLFLLADTLRLFGIVGVSESSYERKLAQLREYMMSNNLPRTLRSRMIKYYEYKLQKRYFNEAEILGSLSEHLRGEIFLFSARTLMHTANLFKYLTASGIAELINLMKLETFAPGDVIFKPNQQHHTIYFISSGTVSMENKDGLELCHLEDGEIFGLMQTIAAKAEYCATVIETTDIFAINIHEFFRFLSEFPEALQYLKLMARETAAYYKKMEDTAKKKVDTCLVELKKGRLLEKRRRKKVAYD